MSTVFILLFLASLTALLVGLMRPSWIKQETRRKVSWLFGSATVISFIIVAIVSPKNPEVPVVRADDTASPVQETIPTAEPVAEQKAAVPEPVVQPKPAEVPQSQTSQTSKAAAQKELDELMALSKKAGLITSYEFSNVATVVYADSVWYTQTVQFKKDFLAKIGMLKKQITGYMHFEVRDAYSNEKLAEVTAFSSSLQVYK